MSIDANGCCAGSLQYTLVQQVHLFLFMANGQFEIRLDESPQMVTGFIIPQLQLVAFWMLHLEMQLKWSLQYMLWKMEWSE